MKRRRGAGAGVSFDFALKLTSTSTTAAIVRLYGYGLLIMVTGQVFCKSCEGVKAASLGQRVQLESFARNSYYTPVTELSDDAEAEDFLVQSWFEPQQSKSNLETNSIRELLLREVHRGVESAKPIEDLPHYGYGDYPDGSIHICKITIIKDDDPDTETSTTTPGADDDDDEVSDSTPPGDEIGTLPDSCYYDEAYEWTRHLVCSDANMEEIPMNIPPELDVFEMTATSVRCVRSRAFSNVQVQELNLKENKIQYVADDAFEDVIGLQRLRMNNNHLQVPVWFHAHAGLETLTTIELEHNYICMTPLMHENGEPGSLDRLPPNFGVDGPYLTEIQYISLRSNFLELIPSFFFARFRGAQLVWKIDLSACKLSYIDEDAFSPFTKVLLVDLSENPDLMASLTPAAISLAKANINSLVLAYNSLQRIPNEALTIMSRTLYSLELSGNSLLELVDDSFPVMSKLAAINLDSCKLSRISRNAFQNLPNLKVLSLRENELTTIPAALGALVNLRVLRLCDNRDSRGTAFQIADKAFESLTRLKSLYMNKLPLNSLNAITFEGLTSLEFLSMQNSNVGAIEPGLFSHTPNLTHLDMRNNPLTAGGSIDFGLSPTPDYGLHRLQTLILSGCGLFFPTVSEGDDEQPPIQPFAHLESLQTLDLSNNLITQLYPELFGTLANLQYLNLNRNRIQPWATQILANNPNLDEVHLSENQLVTTTRCMINDFRAVQSAVDLTENPFSCDAGVCSLKNAVESGQLHLQGWDDPPASYSCYKTPQDRVPISSLTNEVCPVSSPDPEVPPSSELPLSPSTEDEDPGGGVGDFDRSSTSSSTTSASLIIIVVACSLVVLTCGAIAYRRRSDLKYMWLGLRLGKVRHSESGLIRKKKTSDSEGYRPQAENFDYDVFISYSHHDSAFIQEDLVPVLEGKGKLLPNPSPAVAAGDDSESAFRVCLHERDFEVGASITENIIECVDRSRKVLIIVSRNYLESQWCLFEMNLAYHRLIEARRKSFLLILLEEIPAEERTKVLMYLMKSTTYLRWPGAEAGGNEKALFWTRLRTALAALKSSTST